MIQNVVIEWEEKSYNDRQADVVAEAAALKAGGMEFGINKDMTKDEKLKILRKEYSRWNALTNNTDKMIRERAKEMRDLAANLRSQYNK